MVFLNFEQVNAGWVWFHVLQKQFIQSCPKDFKTSENYRENSYGERLSNLRQQFY